MFRAEIQSPYSGSGVDNDTNRPKWGDNFIYRKWQDATGTPSASIPSDPNVYTILVECEEDQINATEAHPDYWVNWAVELIEDDLTPTPASIPGIPTKDEEPAQQRHDDMTAWELGQGFSQQFVDDTLGATPAGRSADEIGSEVASGQKVLPPGVPPPPWALTVKVTRQPGWNDAPGGWLAQLVDFDPDAVPTSVAMGVYANPDGQGYLFTTGAFVDDAELGWHSECPPGQEDTGDIYFSVLYGSAQFYNFTLASTRDEITVVVNGDV